MRPANNTTTNARPKEPRRFLIHSYAESRHEMGGCPNAMTWIVKATVHSPNQVHALRCNQWHCPWCGPRRALVLAYHCESADPTKLITLTCRPSTAPTPRQAFDAIRRRLPDLHKRIREEVTPFDYMRVLEQHDNGYPHWHYVARCGYIPQKWLSSEWERLTGNFRVDIRAIKKRQGCFRYVLKYLCKQSYIPWTNRRVSWSRGFFPADNTPDEPRVPGMKEEISYEHPSTWITNHWEGLRVVEIRPGVWEIEADGHQLDQLAKNAFK